MTNPQQPDNRPNALDDLRARYRSPGGPGPAQENAQPPAPEHHPAQFSTPPVPPPEPPVPAHGDQPGPIIEHAQAWNQSPEQVLGTPQVQGQIANPTTPVPEAESGASEFEVIHSTAARKTAAQRGFGGWMNRVFGTNIGRGEAEIKIDQQRGVVNSSVRFAQVIGVMGPKGGSGKTTTVQALGSTISRNRSEGRVVATDIDEGSILADRMAPNTPSPHYSSVKRLAHDAHLHSAADVNAHLLFNNDGFAVLPGVEVTRDTEITPDELYRVLHVLKHNYTLMLLDFAGSSNAPITKSALMWLDSLVYVCELKPGAIKRAKRHLAKIKEARPDLFASNAVTILLNNTSPAKVGIENIDRHVQDMRSLGGSKGLTVMEINYDPHLAEDGPVVMSHTDRATQDRYLEVAAHVIKHLPKAQPAFEKNRP